MLHWTRFLDASLYRQFASRLLVAAATLVGSIGVGNVAVHAETWNELHGTRSIEADMIGMWNDNVILAMNGRRYTVPMMWFRSDSRIQAQKRWEEIKLARQSRVQELEGQASAAAAPAPDPIPEPPAAPLYQPPVTGTSCADFLKHIDDQIAAGHLLVIYDSLPPSYRTDVSEFVKLAATKIDPATWDSVTAFAHQLGDLVITRQNWLFSNPRIEAIPAEQSDSLEQRLLLVSGILRHGFNPETMQLSTIQSTDFRQWLENLDRAVAPYVAALMEQQSLSNVRNFGVESETADKAVVTMTQSGGDKKVTFVNVDGYWVPEAMAKSWADDMAARKSELEAAAEGSYLSQNLSVLAAMRAMLVPLATAQDANKFHGAMDTMIDASREQVASVASSLGMSLASNERGNRNGGGYGNDMYDMYDEDMYEEDMYDEDYGMDDELDMDNDAYNEQQRREQSQRPRR